jgi:hypothetical protein
MNERAAISAFVETLDLTDRKKGNLIRKLVDEFREIQDMYLSVDEYVSEISRPGGLDDFI